MKTTENNQEKPKKQKKERKKVDSRTFTFSEKQMYIFRFAKRVIKGEIGINSVPFGSRKSVENIVQRYKERKLTLEQINNKCNNAEGIIKNDNKIYGIIGSRGYKFIKNERFITKSKSCYYLYYYIPMDLITLENIEIIFRAGLHPTKHGSASTRCEFLQHQNCAVIKIVTNTCPKTENGKIYYNAKIEINDKGEKIERVPSCDIESIMVNAAYGKIKEK